METTEKTESPKNLEGLFELIAAAKEELQLGKWEECFYRGEPKSGNDLLPSLLRKSDYGDKGLEWTESALFYEFYTRARSLHQLTNDDWDVLFYMRHHGAPTRLIDWTETLGVALYFAIKKRPDKTSPSTLWLLNPYLLNEITWAKRNLISPRFLHKGWTYSDFLVHPTSFKIEYPVAIYPPQKSDRMLAQRGWFTFHGTNKEPINKVKKLEPCHRKIEIPPELVKPIRGFLKRAGINEFTMFPDLTGLSKYLKKKYKFK